MVMEVVRTAVRYACFPPDPIPEPEVGTARPPHAEAQLRSAW